MEFLNFDLRKMLLLLYLFLNIVVFFMYAVDKYKAKHHRWRIPEKTLLIGAWFGIFGAILGMFLMHHKTRKWKFRIAIPLILIVQAAAVFFFTKM